MGLRIKGGRIGDDLTAAGGKVRDKNLCVFKCGGGLLNPEYQAVVWVLGFVFFNHLI